MLLPTRPLDRLVRATDPDDAELLRRYRDAGDAEAFAAIVRRHARTVFGVCRRILADPDAAEDAFQATFLQLVRRARSLHSPVALAAWLYVTARRTALRHRPPAPPSSVPAPAPARGPLDALTARELLTAIEDEIARLPERYRLPLVLCYLDGLSKRQAAERLGLSPGAFCGRLDRGRDKLRAALTRRGFAPAVALGLLVPLAGSAPADLVRRTVDICVRGEPAPAAVTLLAAGRSTGLVPVGLVAGLFLIIGLGSIAASRADPPAPPTRPEPPPAATPSPRLDLYCDVLPPEALARMGTTRWRHVDRFGQHLRLFVPSPTGKLVATQSGGQSDTGTVRVWDLADGRMLWERPWDRGRFGGDVRFTPDGSRLALSMPGGAVRFHDPMTGTVLAESKAFLDRNADFSLTSDLRWIVSGEEKGPLTLTEIVTDPEAQPKRVELEPAPGTFRYKYGGFHADGDTLMSCSYDKSPEWVPLVVRWDIRTGKITSKTPLRGCQDIVVAFSADGKRVATERPHGGLPIVLRAWNTETGAEFVKEDEARHGAGSPFSPDGRRLVGLIHNRDPDPGTAVVWDLDRGKIVNRLTLPKWAYVLCLLPDGKTLLAASYTGMMFGTWDVATGRRLSPDAGHESSVWHLDFTPDGKTLLTGSSDPDEPVTAWDAATGRKRRALAAPHGPSPSIGGGPRRPVVLTPAGAVVTSGKGVLVWTDLATGRELRRLAPRSVTAAMDPGDWFKQEWLALTRDPRTGRPAILTLHNFGPYPLLSDPKYPYKTVVTLLDAETGEVLAHRAEVDAGYHSDGLVVSPDGRWVARIEYASATDVAVELRPALGGRGSIRLPHPEGDGPRRLFTSDGQTLVTVAHKRAPGRPAGTPAESATVRLWEVRTGKKRLEFTVPGELSAVAVSPDGRLLAAQRADTILVRELATGTEVARRSGYGSPVEALAFRPDDRALASGHMDGTALVWDLAGVPAVKLAAADREAAWKDLASADAGKAYRAVLALAADPDGVPTLRDRVKPVPRVPADRLRQLVHYLDDQKYATREAATAELKKLGDVVEVELREALRGELSAEQRRRVTDVLENQESTEIDTDRLRALRWVEVLERAASAEADSALRELSRGAPGARLTREAAAATWRRGGPLR